MFEIVEMKLFEKCDYDSSALFKKYNKLVSLKFTLLPSIAHCFAASKQPITYLKKYVCIS